MEQARESFQGMDVGSIPRFSFENICVYGKVIKVYDGDTFTAVFTTPITPVLYKYTLRVNGVDTPEIRTRNSDEKKRGYIARDYVRSLILDEVVYLRLGKFDKYGRILCNVDIPPEKLISKVDNQDLSMNLIKGGHAHVYDGGTKQSW